jgi:hypothetical protein
MPASCVSSSMSSSPAAGATLVLRIPVRNEATNSLVAPATVVPAGRLEAEVPAGVAGRLSMAGLLLVGELASEHDDAKKAPAHKITTLRRGPRYLTKLTYPLEVPPHTFPGRPPSPVDRVLTRPLRWHRRRCGSSGQLGDRTVREVCHEQVVASHCQAVGLFEHVLGG